jgi:hypothetical protein
MIFNLDHNGQVFTIDALFALLLITVIIGISANAMDIAGDKVRDYSTELSLQRIAGDTADVLIKTPGSPVNWEDIKSFNGVTPGLAEYENGTRRILENTLSMKKVTRLKENPELLNSMLPSTMSCSLMIYPTNTSLPIIQVVRNTPIAGDVTVVNRTVLFDYMLINIYTFIKPETWGDVGSKYICTHSNMRYYNHKLPDFKNRKAGWICSPFTLETADIISKDFYLLTDPPVLKDDSTSKWMIDTTDKITIKAQNFTSTPIMINSRISELSGNKTSEIFVLHVYTSGYPERIFNTYLVGVPKGTSSTDVRLNYMNPQPAFFILRLWL